jgi:AbrB family looped-hinge helix DNA binding protein
LSRVRVKRKGQVTIPAELRAKLRIDEGDILEAGEREGTIVLTPSPPLEGGEVVGRDVHRKVIEELDELRRRWR